MIGESFFKTRHHKFEDLQPGVEEKYAEILNPNPPSDPKEKKSYYDNLLANFPEAGTPDFAVLAELLVDSSGKWANRELWEEFVKRKNLEFSEKVREVFSPLCKKLADETGEYIENGIRKENVDKIVETGTFSFDDLRKLADTDLDFIRIAMFTEDEIKELYQLPFSPSDEDIAAKFGDKHSPRMIRETIKSGLLDMFPSADKALQAKSKLAGMDYLKNFAELGESEKNTVLVVRSSYERNYKKDRLLKKIPFDTEKTDSFVFNAKAELSTPIPTPIATVPVGPYGREFAAHLAQAIAVLEDIARKQLKNDTERIDKEFESSLLRDTARRNSLNTVIESIGSVKDAIVLVMSQIKEGEDPEEFFKDIVEQDLPTKLARIVPMGAVGPLVLSGQYIKELTERDDDGSFSFSCPMRKGFKGHRKSVRQKNYDEQGKTVTVAQDDFEDTKAPFRVKLKTKPTGETGYGCPVAYKRAEEEAAGVTYVTKAIFDLYKEIKKLN